MTRQTWKTLTIPFFFFLPLCEGIANKKNSLNPNTNADIWSTKKKKSPIWLRTHIVLHTYYWMNTDGKCVTQHSQYTLMLLDAALLCSASFVSDCLLLHALKKTSTARTFLLVPAGYQSSCKSPWQRFHSNALNCFPKPIQPDAKSALHPTRCVVLGWHLQQSGLRIHFHLIFVLEYVYFCPWGIFYLRLSVHLSI